MIKFVTGTANLDISERLCSEISTLIKSKDHIVYIVPEQFEYASELKIYNLLEDNGLLHLSGRVKVKTFTSLSREVLEKCNDTRPIADDIVKNVIIHNVVNNCANDLKTFRGICKKPGFSQKILATIKGFKAVGLSDKKLSESLDKINDPNCELSKNTLLMSKLSDVSLLYTEYSVQMKNYLDAPDITELAAENLKTSGILSGADIIVDCFNDFTGGQMKFIKSMIPLANSVMFGFTTNYKSDNDVFQSANGNINDICTFAKKEGINTKFADDGIAPRKGLCAPISELSLKIFSDQKSDVEPGDSIELISAKAIPEELDFVCSKIIALVDDDKKKLRYRDIAVLCTDLGTYGRYVESAFKKYNIPIFLDTHESILNQPLTNTVISILNALDDFSVDTVISCLKTGFFSKPYTPKEGEPEKKRKKERVGLTNYEINSFEDYVLEWAITTNHLMSPFEFPKNHDSDISDNSDNPDKPDKIDYKKQAAEMIRREVAIPLYDFSKKIKKDVIDGAKLTEMLYNFLIKDVGVARALDARTHNQDKKEKTENQDNQDERDEEQYAAYDKESKALHTRLWNALIKIFNALHKELDGKKISIKEYTDMFRDLCADTTLSSPPQMVDRVLVGDIDRTRANGVRAAFIIGATYESFPTDSSQTGVFSQYEADLICSGISKIDDKEKVEIFKSAREQFALAKYRAYKAMTLPTEYLCITAPDMNTDGERNERSEVTHELSRLFTKKKEWSLEVRKASTYTDKSKTAAPAADGDPDISGCLTNEFYCRSEQATKSRYALNLGVDPYADAVLEEALEKNNIGDFVELLKEIRSEHETDNTIGEQFITPEQAKLLFPDTISATLIEKLFACPFNFFTKKGLNIRDKKKRIFNSSMRGNALHHILEKVLSEYYGDMEKLCSLTRADFMKLSEKYLKEYCDQETNGDFNEDERSRFLFRNITHSAADVLISMQAEFFARGFRPKFFELDLNTDRNDVPVPEDPPKPTAAPPAAEIYSVISDESPSEEDDTSKSRQEAVLSDKNTINTAPFEIKVDDTFSVYITGRIDRMDMYTVQTGSDKKTYVRMVDYKSSTHDFNLGLAMNGINVQMLLYMLAILDANKDNPLNLSAGGLTYISSKSSGALKDPTGAFMLLTKKHLGKHLLVKDENLNSDLENYKTFLREKATLEDGKTALMTADIDSLSEEQKKERNKYESALNDMLSSFNENEDDNTVNSERFDILREAITEKMTEKLCDLFKGGNVTAAPKADDANYPPCTFCTMQCICKNGSKNVEVVSKNDWKIYLANKEQEMENAEDEEGEGEGGEEE